MTNQVPFRFNLLLDTFKKAEPDKKPHSEVDTESKPLEGACFG